MPKATMSEIQKQAMREIRGLIVTNDPELKKLLTEPNADKFLKKILRG